MSTHSTAFFQKSVLRRTAARCLQVPGEPDRHVREGDGRLTARRLDYTWIDANRKQVKLPAPTYIDYVMSWVQQTIDNGRDFPTKRVFAATGS